MPGIVQRPTVVEEAVDRFADLFDNKCQREHFGNYLTGLMIGNNKTVTGITDEFVNASDQSLSQSVFQRAPLNEVDWDEQELNRRRLDWLVEQGDIHVHPRGVLAIDNVLIDHYGKLIEDAGWFWDLAEDRYKIGTCRPG